MNILKKILLTAIWLCFFSVSFVTHGDIMDDVIHGKGDASDYIWTKAASFLFVDNRDKVEEYVKNQNENIFVVVTRFLLKLSIWVWIIAIMIIWIKFIISFDESKMKAARKSLIVVLIWLFVSFSAYYILELMVSLSKTAVAVKEYWN